MKKLVACSLLTLSLIAGSVSAGPAELIVFSGKSCLPCREMEPAVKQIEQAGVRVYRVDYDQQRAYSDQWRVTAMPTTIVYRDGKEIGRLVGKQTLDQLKAAVMTSAVRTSPPNPLRPVINSFNWLLSPFAASHILKPEDVVKGPQQQGVKPLSLTPAQIKELAIGAHVRVVSDEGRVRSYGSGVIIITGVEDGVDGSTIETNRHVVEDSQGVKIDAGNDYWSDGDATVFWVSQFAEDLAGIKASKPAAYSAAIAPKGHTIKNPVFSVGSAHGESPKVKTGNVIDQPSTSAGPCLVMDYEFSQGESGGGIFDSTGYLVGIIYGSRPQECRGVAVDLTRTHAISDKARARSQQTARLELE